MAETIQTLSERVSTDEERAEDENSAVLTHDLRAMSTSRANIYNCSNVQLGHRLHYHAPVVINQNFLNDSDRDTAKIRPEDVAPNGKVKVRYKLSRLLKKLPMWLTIVLVFIANVAMTTTVSLIITHSNREKIITEESSSPSWKKFKRYLDMLQKYNNISKDWTSVAVIAEYGNSELLETLLDCGADPDTLNKGGLAAIHIAAKRDSNRNALTLIKYSANLTIRTRDEGDTPLILAASFNRLRLATLLLEQGVPADCKNKLLDTPLHFAAMNDNVELCHRLLHHGACVNARNNVNETALYASIGLQAEKAIRLLIAKGADVNLPNNKMETPLHYAAIEDDVNLTRLLIENGADVYARDYLHRTPIDVAKPSVKDWLSSYLSRL